MKKFNAVQSHYKEMHVAMHDNKPCCDTLPNTTRYSNTERSSV